MGSRDMRKQKERGKNKNKEQDVERAKTENIMASRAGFTAGENNDCNDEMCSISPRG